MLNLPVIFPERNVFFTAYSVLVYCFTSAVHSVNRTSALTILTKMDEATVKTLDAAQARVWLGDLDETITATRVSRALRILNTG